MCTVYVWHLVPYVLEQPQNHYFFFLPMIFSPSLALVYIHCTGTLEFATLKYFMCVFVCFFPATPQIFSVLSGTVGFDGKKKRHANSIHTMSCNNNKNTVFHHPLTSTLKIKVFKRKAKKEKKMPYKSHEIPTIHISEQHMCFERHPAAGCFSMFDFIV